MPKLLALLSLVGIVAMIWVGGHILIVGFDDIGWSALYDLVHSLEEAAADTAHSIGGIIGWLVNTAASALVGLVVGAAAVAVMHVLPRRSRAASP